MATFSYKGYDFDVDHTPSEDEFTQMSAYVDSLPPKETQPTLMDKAIGVGEAALNTGTALTTGTLAGAVGGLQGIIDSVSSGTFGTQEGVTESGKKFHEYADMATYTPKTMVGKEYSDKVGKVISEQAPALVGAMPQLEALARLGKPAVAQLRENAAGNPNAPISEAAQRAAAKLQERRATAAKTQGEAKGRSSLPEETTTMGAQMDLFRETPEQIIERQRMQAADESAGILRDAQGPQGDLFLGVGKEPETHIVPPDARPAEIEAAYAQRDQQRKQQFDLDSERLAAQQEPLTLEPEQGTKVVESPQERTTYRPNSQRGSVGFFGESSFEKFSEDMRKAIPDVTQQEIQQLWKEEKETQKTPQVAAALGKINPKLAENLSIYRDVSREDALGAVRGSPDADTTTLGFMRNNILSRGRLGAEKIKNEGVKSGLAYMIGLKDKGGIAANQALHGPNGILRDLRKLETLFAEGEAGEVLRQRQEAQFNPDYQFKLSQEQAKVHKNIDTLFESIRSDMERLTGKPIHKVPYYFPNMFYGPFTSEIRDSGGRLVAFVTEKSAKKVAEAAQQVAGELGEGYSISNPKYRKEITSEGFKNRTGLAPYFEAMLDLLSSDDPTVLKAQESVQRVISKRAMDTRQMQNRLKYKTGVVGAEGQKSWKNNTENYRDAKDVLENYVRGFEEWKSNMESAKFLNELKETHGATNTYNILQNQFDDIRGTNQISNGIVKDLENAMAKTTGHDVSQLAVTGARKSAGALTKLWLGFYNPAALAQNILQPMHTIPKLSELMFSGGSKDIISPFIIGMAKSLKDGMDITLNKTLNKDLTERAKYLQDFEVIKPGLVEAENRTKAGHYVEKGLVSGGLLATEAFARTTTFNIFETYLQNSGYSKEQARSLAKNLTHDYQVNYENYAKPGIVANTGVAGELAGRLQSFKANQMTQLANYIVELKQEKNPVPLATSLALSIGMAGVSGMIGMDIAEGIYGLLVTTGLVDPDTRSPRQMAMDLGGAAAYGIPSEVTGKWLSGSLTSNLVGDMSWRNIAPIFAGVYEVASKLPIAGKIAKDVIKGETTVPLSEKAQLIGAITPTSVRGRFEDKLLTDPEGRVTSPYTGQVGYVNQEADKGLLSKFTNLRSVERGESLARKSMLTAQEKRIKTAIDSKLTNLQKLVDEDVRMNRPVDDQVFANHIQRIIDLGGDPAQTVQKVKDFTISNHMGDWFEQQVAKGKINLGSVNKKLRAIDERGRMYGSN